MIRKTYQVTPTINASLKIIDGKSFLVTNDPKATKIMYEILKRKGNKVKFERNYVLIEEFSESDEEYSQKLDKELSSPEIKEKVREEITGRKAK